MPMPIITLASPKYLTRIVSVSLIALSVFACTLTDYSYLGAKRDALVDEGETGGATTTTSGSQLTGGSANGGGTSNGGNTGKSSTGGTATGGSVATGGADTGGAIATGGKSSTGGTATGGSVSVATGGTATGGSVSVATGGTSTGGAIATGGKSSTGGGTSTGGSVATGGTNTGGAMTCSGCARLDVPFTSTGRLARYYLVFSPMVTVNERSTSTGAVLNEGMLKIRAYAPQLGNSSYEMLLQQSSGDYTICYSAIQPWPSSISSSWVTLEWSLATCANGDNDIDIGRLGFDLIAPADGPTPSNTTIWLDSIWLELKGETIVGPFNFSTASTVNAAAITNDYEQAPGVLYLRPSATMPPTAPFGTVTPPIGSTISWLGQ